ncbi:homeobox protein cut-like 1 [Mizuhopecten yessoensis]|uniref:One cut domain family member n=1 Tax=Mizuhopecten yessoensis TaxID=6573 RepID=A0A210Q167_MIZYE|nr:homeobox protein cut-like 1 [Mizuhopecten yessoensis]OWF42478.1 Double homeobox protein 4C [Mizuhopecten yessoensis]
MENTAINLEALERTAAWVQQVSQMKGQAMEEDPLPPDSGLEETDSGDGEPLSQFHNIYQQLQDQFNTSSGSEVDIPSTVKEFKDVLEKFGISQRFAAKNIMEKTSQGNLSFLLDKGRNKQWHELSPRGRVPYVRMRRWLDSTDEQKHTMSLLQKTKEYKKTGPKDGFGRREKFTVFQLMVLCRFFEEDPNPNLSTRALLAEKLGAPVDRITIWFQNQRARGFPAKKMLSQSNFSRKAPGAMDAVTSSTSRTDASLPAANFLPSHSSPFNLSTHILQNMSHLPPSIHGQNTASLSSSDLSDSFRGQSMQMAAHLNSKPYVNRLVPAHLQGQGHLNGQSYSSRGQSHLPDSTMMETPPNSEVKQNSIKTEFQQKCEISDEPIESNHGDQPLNFSTNNNTTT